MSSSSYYDDYLDDYDLDSYDLDDYDLDDYDQYLDDYLDDYSTTTGPYPTKTYDYSDLYTSTGESYPTATSSSYDDYLDDDDDDDDDDDSSSSSGSGSGSGSSGSDSSDITSSDFDWDDLPTNGDPSLGGSSTGSSGGGLPSGYGAYGAYGGSDLSNQKTSKTCVSDAAFKQNAPKVDLAFDVIFLVLFLALAGVAGFRLLKSKQKGSAIGKWFLFPISLFFAILYILIDMITLILSQCVMMRADKYQQALTAVRWFDNLSIYLLIVLILLPICLKLQGSGTFKTITLFGHGAWLALCGIFLVVSLACFSKIQTTMYKDFEVPKADFIKSTRGVTMTYYVFLFLAALLATANMALALFRRANIRKGLLFISIPALILSTLILTLVLMGGFADLEYGKKDRKPEYYEKSGDAQVFLKRFFYAAAFASALVIAGAQVPADDSSQAAPVASQPQQPANQYPQPAPPMAQPVSPYQQSVSPVPTPPPQQQYAQQQYVAVSGPVPAQAPAPVPVQYGGPSQAA